MSWATVHGFCTVGSCHERFVENKSGNCFIANWLIHQKKGGICLPAGSTLVINQWLIAHLSRWSLYLLFALCVDHRHHSNRERWVQQNMHQVNPALVGSSYPGSVLVSKTSTHYIPGEVAFPSLMIGWVWIPLLWSGDASVLEKGSQKSGHFSWLSNFQYLGALP